MYKKCIIVLTFLISLLFPYIKSNAAEDVYTTILEGFQKKDSYIDLSEFGLSKNDADLDPTIKAVMFDNPELYWACDWYSRSVSGNMLKGIYPMYYEKCEDDVAFNAAVDSIVNYVNTLDDPIKKVKYIHDYLLLSTVYDVDISKGTARTDIPNIARSPYGALINHSTVCMGYSRAFQLIASKTGINSITVTNLGGTHVWNMVEIGDRWFHLDINNDRVAKAGTTGYIIYDYFLIPNEVAREFDTYKEWVIFSKYEWKNLIGG